MFASRQDERGVANHVFARIPRLAPRRCIMNLQRVLVYIARRGDYVAGKASESFLRKSRHVAPVLKILPRAARAAEPPGHGADDAQSRHRECSERADGAVLCAAGY